MKQKDIFSGIAKLIIPFSLFFLVLFQSVIADEIPPCPEEYGFIVQIPEGELYLNAFYTIRLIDSNCIPEVLCWEKFSSFELEYSGTPLSFTWGRQSPIPSQQTLNIPMTSKELGTYSFKVIFKDIEDQDNSCEITSPNLAFVPCIPVEEICKNGIDDNCNGLIDDADICPIAKITRPLAYNNSFMVNQEIFFASTNSDYSFLWSFGDNYEGHPESTYDNFFTNFAYAKAGTYTVNLLVENWANQENDSVQRTIEVGCYTSEDCIDDHDLCCNNKCVPTDCVIGHKCADPISGLQGICTAIDQCTTQCVVSEQQEPKIIPEEGNLSLSNNSIIENPVVDKNDLNFTSNPFFLSLSKSDQGKVYAVIFGEDYSEKELQDFIEKVELTADKIIISKNITIKDNKTLVEETISPKEELKNIDLYLSIPKCMAQKLNEVYFASKGYNVVADDPMVVWHFDEIIEEVDLSYEVFKEVTDKDCQDQAVIIAVAKEIEGSIIKKQDMFSSNILMVLLGIPILVFVFISTKRFIRADKLHEEVFRSKISNNDIFDEKTILKKNIKQIAQYIDKESSKGLNAKEIITNLKKVGWTEELIKESIPLLNKEEVKFKFDDYYKNFPK